MIKINEIFFSIQGESTTIGCPTVFVRTTACNLRCSYCDTKYSYYEGEDWSTDSLLQKIRSFPTKYVCITGGEPLLQKEILPLMTSLCDEGYLVSLETSGSRSCEGVDSRVRTILDVKTPDSGAANSFLMKNLEIAPSNTEIKFVITSENDFYWSEKFCHENQLFDRFTVLYSPSHESISPRWLAEMIIEKGSKARCQLQLHKYIWPSETRGV